MLKRLKNIEDENKVKHKVENKDKIEVTDFVDEPLSFKAKELIKKIKTIQKNVDYRKLKFRGGNNVDYDFSDYKTFKELFRDLYYRKITIDDAESKQDEFTAVLTHLKIYNPRDNKYIKEKNNLVDNASKFYEGEKKLLKRLKIKYFQFIMMSVRSLGKKMKKMKNMKEMIKKKKTRRKTKSRIRRK